jgi:hypothetical protein
VLLARCLGSISSRCYFSALVPGKFNDFGVEMKQIMEYLNMLLTIFHRPLHEQRPKNEKR